MNPELLTIEVPNHLIKAIKEKLDDIFEGKEGMNGTGGKHVQRKTRITSENSEIGRKILAKASKRSLKAKESKIAYS